jgi:hypothetical protein
VHLEIKRIDTLMMEITTSFKSVEETPASTLVVDDTKGVEEVL